MERQRSNFRGTFFTELNITYNPQANGQAESTVKKYKSLLKILTYKTLNMKSKLSQTGYKEPSIQLVQSRLKCHPSKH